MLPSHLIIFEGPAGSGKTHFATTAEELGFPVVKQSLPWRMAPGRGTAVIPSLLNDLHKLAQAVEYASRSPVVVIDRCWLSQWVYRQLRLQSSAESALESVSPQYVYGAFEDALYLVEREVNWRAETTELRQLRIQGVTFYLLLPSVKQLRKQRELQRERGYPWPPELELSYYRQLVIDSPPGICRVIPVESAEHRSELMRGLITLSMIEEKEGEL